jgi:hypothetical protein
LLERPVKLVEFLLCLEYSLQLVVGLLLLVLVLLLEDLVLLLCLHSVSLDDVVVVVGPLELSLHLCELMLNSIELNTCVFSSLLNLPNFLFLLSQLQVDSLVLVRQLFSEGVLQTGHQRLFKTWVSALKS